MFSSSVLTSMLTQKLVPVLEGGLHIKRLCYSGAMKGEPDVTDSHVI